MSSEQGREEIIAGNKDVVASNRLVAEFMGGRYEPNYRQAPKNIPVFAIDAGSVEDLKYHSSWDWLMPVVQKIEDLEDGKPKFEIWISKFNVLALRLPHGGASLRKEVPHSRIEITPDCSKIQAVWLSVIAFITWYNTQQHGK